MMSDENEERLHECNQAVLEPGFLDGEVWVASSIDGEGVEAVAVWCPPGVGFWET